MLAVAVENQNESRSLLFELKAIQGQQDMVGVVNVETDGQCSVQLE